MVMTYETFSGRRPLRRSYGLRGRTPWAFAHDHRRQRASMPDDSSPRRPWRGVWRRAASSATAFNSLHIDEVVSRPAGKVN